MAPQPPVGVRIFVFFGVLKGPSDHPDTICLRRWCVSVFIQDLSVYSCVPLVFYVPVCGFM